MAVRWRGLFSLYSYIKHFKNMVGWGVGWGEGMLCVCGGGGGGGAGGWEAIKIYTKILEQ